MQPQGHLQLVLHTVDGGLDPQAALEQPRWYWQSGLRVLAEDGLDFADLPSRGHEVTVSTDTGVFGMGQAIWCLPQGGFVAGSEPRGDGQAAAW